MAETWKVGDTVQVTGKHCTPGFAGKIGILWANPEGLTASIKFEGVKYPVFFIKTDISLIEAAKILGS